MKQAYYKIPTQLVNTGMSENRPRTRRWLSSQTCEGTPKKNSKKTKKKKGNPSKSTDKFTDYTTMAEKPGEVLDLKSIIEHMESIQKRSDKAMADSIKEAIENSKCEINQNTNGLITTLTTNVNDIRRDLSKMENVFNTRLQKIELDMTGISQRVQETSADVARIEKATATDLNHVKSKIKKIEGESVSLKENVDKKLIEIRTEMIKRIEDQNALVEKQQSDLESWKKKQERETDTIRARSYGNENQIRQNTTQIDGIDSKIRAENVVIEGILEKEDETKIQTDITDLIQKALPGFKSSNIRAVMRLGKQRKAKKKPRPLMVTLDNQATRELLLTHATAIKTNSGNKYLWINRDQSDNAKRRHSLVKACYKLLLDRGYACSMRGSVITYQKKQYTYDTLNLLPESCTPFYVKSRETTDKTGLCFYSEHTYCSNFCPSPIRYKGGVYSSVEHAFQLTKVKDEGYTELAAEMIGMTNPYHIKNLGDGITASKKWKAKEEEIMRDLIAIKFQQNEKLRTRLLEDGYKSYYEMTLDKKWATGCRITPATKAIDKASLKGDNLTGRIVSEVKADLIKKYKNPLGSANQQQERQQQQLNQIPENTSAIKTGAAVANGPELGVTEQGAAIVVDASVNTNL